jgi:hypothetical protein
MADREEVPVWAKILLGIPVTDDSHSHCAGQPGEGPAPAPNQSPDHWQRLLRLDRVLRNQQRRRRMLLREAVQ